MIDIVNIRRRRFLRTNAPAGGGLVLGFCFPFADPTPGSGMPPDLPALNAFIRIDRDGAVTFMLNKSEMGQGVYTALAMLLSEELECDWRRVRVEAAPVDPAYNHTQWGIQGTGGSTSVMSEWERLSKVGATARQMLIAAAAGIWKVDPASCRAENGCVIHGSGKSFTYGKLAEKAAGMPVPKGVLLKKPEAYKILGKPLHRLDSPAKVNGTARFGLDVTVPGMLTVLIVRSPVFAGKVVRFSAEKAKGLPGVKEVVQVPSGVAVVGTDFWAASEGRRALEIVWDEGKWSRLSTAGLREEYARLAATPGAVARKEGDPEKALSKAARTLHAEYEVPYLAHAPMEPLNCVVDLRADGCDIWTGTQLQTPDRDAAARTAGLKPEQVRLHTTYLGGGFGRRANPHSDFVLEAVEVAKAVKKPVKVVWSREDDTKGGYYRPMWLDRVAAGLDASGSLSAWRHTIVGQSILAGTPFEAAGVTEGIDALSVEGAADIPYAIPNLLVDLHSPEVGVPVLWWRSVGHSHTAFVVEGFLDEAAHAAAKDPFEFRRTLLSDKPRHRRVLELAAEKAGWGKPVQAGRGRGIAVHASYGSFVAQVAEVSVSPEGRVQVHRVVCVIDCGRIVNPDIIASQMESGIVFGLSAALHGAITLKNGRVEQGNFDDYPVLRMSEMPLVEVNIVPSREAPGGVGEPGVPPIAPAVANAVFAAAGARLRSLPMTPETVLKAMKNLHEPREV